MHNSKMRAVAQGRYKRYFEKYRLLFRLTFAFGNHPAVLAAYKVGVYVFISVAYANVVVTAVVVQKSHGYFPRKNAAFRKFVKALRLVFTHAVQRRFAVYNALFGNVLHGKFLFFTVDFKLHFNARPAYYHARKA